MYFCTQGSYGTAFNSIVMASLTPCKDPWSYKFHVFTGRMKSKEAPVLLTFGKSIYSNLPACCKKNPDSFDAYVVDSGKAKSFDYPDGNLPDETDYSGDYAYLYWDNRRLRCDVKYKTFFVQWMLRHKLATRMMMLLRSPSQSTRAGRITETFQVFRSSWIVIPWP